jgi:hypothetical protein
MSDFALVIYEQHDIMPAQHHSFAGRILSALKRTKYECTCKKIDFYRNVSAYVIKLPWSLERILSLDKHKIGAMISSKCRENGATECLVPRELWGVLSTDGFTRSNSCDELLYKLLILDILNEIYSTKNIEISLVDVAIVSGNNGDELFCIVRLLSTLFKYITIISSEREGIDSEINDIYVDSGLSIGVTSDYKNGLKNADLIINLGDSNEHIFNAKINPKALILNYGKLDINKILAENTLINGIEIALPHSIDSKVDKEIYQYYEKPEISLTILTHRFLSYDILREFNKELSKKASKQFEKDGWRISGFIGRRRKLTVDEIVI